MTKLKHPVRRELPISFDRRQWSVTLYGWGLELRAKRERKTYDISWESVIGRAIEIYVNHQRAEKLRARTARGSR